MATKNKILQLLLLVTLFVTTNSIQAQKTDISIRVFPSSWYNSYYEPGFDGGGLCVTYHPILNKIYRLNISGEFSVLRSRNEVLLGFGINKTIWQAERFRVSTEANLLNGIDLYKPYPLYVGGIEVLGRFDYYLKKKLTLFAAIGARVTVCPGYRSFGVWKHSSWPIMVGVRF
ncbi:MAG: hypothetical protein WC865_08195 [Bacteroidales bacterium]